MLSHEGIEEREELRCFFCSSCVLLDLFFKNIVCFFEGVGFVIWDPQRAMICFSFVLLWAIPFHFFFFFFMYYQVNFFFFFI